VINAAIKVINSKKAADLFIFLLLSVFNVSILTELLDLFILKNVSFN